MPIRMMTSELRDAQFNLTGQWPEGAYCDLHWSRQKGWKGDATNDFTSSGGLVMQETHTGLVLGTFERNGYSDSDFVAIVWNPVAGKIETVEYATTRGWCYPNEASVDATVEVRAAAEVYLRDCQVREQKRRLELMAMTPEFDRQVEITATRGKAKAYHGQRGEVCWMGPSINSKYETRIGVRLLDGQKVFLPAAGAVAIVNDQKAPMSLQEAQKNLSIARMADSYSALPAF